MGRYTGTKSNDLFRLSMSQLAGSTVNGGGGADTLAISTTGGYTFKSASFSSLSSIESLDFGAHQTGTLNVYLSSSMLSQSGNGTLTVVSGASGIDTLKAASSLGGNVWVAGTGNVWLDGTADNTVRIQSNATVAVHGGAGADSITAASTGSLLDGGAGRDALFAGAGADRVAFGAGSGADTVTGFNAAQDTVTLSGTNFRYMSEVLARTTDTAAGAAIDLGFGDVLTLAGVTRASLTAANFSGIVEGAPSYTIDTGMTAAQVNALLASAGDGATFVLADGLHVFDQAIIIAHDNVIFRGESEAGTIVRFDFAAGAETHGIAVMEGDRTSLGTATGAIAEGQTSLTLASTAGLKAGDTLYVVQQNDAGYLAANGWTNVSAADMAAHPFREAHVAIARIEGNTVFLTHEIPYAMTAGAAEVYKTDLVHGLSLSDFTVDSGLGAANPNNFVNLMPAYDGLAAIYAGGTSGASIHDVSILNAPSVGLEVSASLDMSVDNLTVRGAWNKGEGGNGYGLEIGETFNSSFTNLDITDMRHAVLFSGWDSEANNTIHVANTNRDINFHGGPETGNVITVDHAVLSYNPAEDTSGGRGFWPIVGDNVATHANVDPYADNLIDFSYAIASDANDRFSATDGGAYLNGRGGMDTITGGAGDDLIIGGLNKDTMTGGAGTDTFLVRVGDNYDRIADFDTRAGGDRIVIAGTGGATSFAGLQMTQNGADLSVRYGANATLIFANHTASDLTADHFVFAGAGTPWDALF